jgi:glycine dehydrogenase subunit 1
MSYIPHTEADRQEMLAAIGVERIADLFVDVPDDVRFPDLVLPQPLSEQEILAELTALSEENADAGHLASFLGAGAYHHFVPSVVNHVISRSEFYTAYTPYQPEISQGTLQSIFEYQSMICALTGMEVANASHYDGATSTAEAVIMALNVARRRRSKMILLSTVHPQYRQTVHTYTLGMGLAILDTEDLCGVDSIRPHLDEDTACVVVQSPSFFGEIEPIQEYAEAAHAVGALLVVVANPISLGLFHAPGTLGADIVVGEGQPLGNGLNFGGPYLGFFACRDKQKRQMAGRLVGQTVDAAGKRGFVLTLATREQHIRRERATSNICTNQALNALAAGVYLATLGKTGLRKLAELNYHKAHYAANRIAELEGYEITNPGVFFNEFCVRCPVPVCDLNRYLLEEWGIIGGYDLGKDYETMAGQMLLAVTEMNTAEEIEDLVAALAEAREVLT